MSLLKSVTDKLRGKTPDGMPSQDTVEAIRENLKTVFDPDLHKDIVSLGFVKAIQVNSGKAQVTVELTTPACPVKEQLKAQIEEQILKVPGVSSADVNMTAQTSRGTKGVSDQAQQSIGAVKNIIAVAAGKGGVGKSTTAVNLAFALAKTGSKVGILDADVYGPSVPQMTQVNQPTEMAGQMLVPPTVDGIKVISVAMFTQGGQASMLRGPMAAQVIKQFLTQVAWGELDYLVIDYPPGTGDIQLTLSQIAPITGAVIVTTPQEVALMDVRKAIGLFNTMKVPILGVIETMSYFVCDGCDKKHYIFRQGGGDHIATEFGLPLLGQIPIGGEVAQSSDEGKPVVQYAGASPVAQAYQQAAGKVAQQLSILNAQDAGSLNYFALDWQK